MCLCLCLFQIIIKNKKINKTKNKKTILMKKMKFFFFVFFFFTADIRERGASLLRLCPREFCWEKNKVMKGLGFEELQKHTHTRACTQKGEKVAKTKKNKSKFFYGSGMCRVTIDCALSINIPVGSPLSSRMMRPP